MALAAAPDVPGFRALSPLGYGPTSTLYSAQSISLGRWVALTVYSTTLTDDRAQRRFTRGFETARRLGSHPHAVTMLECGATLDRRPYVATEIYERGTLDGRVAGRKPLTIDEALHMAIAVAGALETAHRAGVLHGGVHPARVLVGNDGEPALADLGLVPLVERSGLAALVGPMSYHTAPEVLEGEPVSPATDVYSLASTLYTALTGRAPYQGGDDDDTVASLLLRILQHAVPPIENPQVPRSLEWLLHQALSCEPKDRPERPLALARALQGCQQELHLAPTEPVVLDIAGNLRLAGGDDPADPLDDDGYEAGGAGSSGGSVRSMLGTGALGPGSVVPGVVRPETPAGGSTVQRVFVPYTAPEDEPEPETGPLDGGRGTGHGAGAGVGAGVGGGQGPGGLGFGLTSVPGGPDLPDMGLPAGPVDDPGTRRPTFTVPASPAPLDPPSARASTPTPLFPATLSTAPPPPAVAQEPPQARLSPLAPLHDLAPERAPASPARHDPFPPAGPTEDGTTSSPWPDLPLDPPLVPGGFDPGDRGGAPESPAEPGAGAGAEAEGSSTDRTSSATSVPPGPRALPVLVLMGLVAVLVAGVSWMIVTGEDPAQEEPPGTSTTDSRAIDGSGSGSDSGSESGSGSSDRDAGGVELTATENANGVQLDWEESGSGNQVVLVLSATEAPRLLPAETGTALLVPSAGLQPQVGYCFAVATAEGPAPNPTQLASQLPTGAIPPASCIRGATGATVRRE